MASNEKEQATIDAFLDGVAEFFDNGTPVYPETLFEFDGYAVSAQQLLQYIRLHESLERLGK